MYDEKKLNAYWKDIERRHAIWRTNGWKGPGNPGGRDIDYPCGHSVWAGFGLSAEVLKNCDQCRFIAKHGEEYD